MVTEKNIAEFFDRLAGWREFLSLLDHLEGVTFFMKNLDGQFMAFSDGMKRCLDFGSPEQLIGVTDYELYPKHVADRIAKDDQKVFERGEPLLNIVELLVNPRRAVIGWYVTNKFPLHDRDGNVIGLMGTVQTYDGRRRNLLEGTPLDGVIERIRKNPAEVHRLEELAAEVGLSPRQLGRRFHEILGMSPRDFIMNCRMAMACQALAHTDQSVAGISVECGFYDQSAFAHQFRKSIGLSPLEYRKRYFASHKAASEIG